jgi:hypothetical protein
MPRMHSPVLSSCLGITGDEKSDTEVLDDTTGSESPQQPIVPNVRAYRSGKFGTTRRERPSGSHQSGKTPTQPFPTRI